MLQATLFEALTVLSDVNILLQSNQEWNSLFYSELNTT